MGLTVALLLIVAPAAGAATVDTWPDFTGRQVVAGQTLDGTSTASGTPAAVISYEWQQCDPIAVCSPIPGEVGPTYAVRTADVGFQIQLVVTATDLGSPDTKSSGRTAPVTDPAKLTGPPTIAGTAATGQTLTASASATGTPTPTITFQWQRCDSAGAACADIPGETTSQHVLTSADAGKTLRVVATATNTTGTDTQTSAATAVIASPADDGTRGTTTTPTDTSGATIVSSAPTPAPVPDGPAQTPAPTAEPTPAPARLQPFPVVRIRGQLVRGGARVSVFSVTAPKGARIEIGCSGRGCPRKSLALTARKSGLVRLRAYERYLPAGVRITVRVSQPGTIGKYASFVIRADGGPRRQDMCLPPGKRVPVRCSA